MKIEWCEALEATRPRSRFVVIALALVILMAITIDPLTTASASASTASTSSTLCSGYTACSQIGFTTHGYQNNSTSSYWQMYAGNNCTNYVAYVESAAFQVTTPSFDLGNAAQWAASALAHGMLVNTTPTVGSVAVWTGASSGMTSSGHVAVVEAVGPNASYVVISQQHMKVTDGYDWVRIVPSTTGNQWEQWPNEFIHFVASTAALTRRASPTLASVLERVAPRRAVRVQLAFHLASARR